MKCPNQFCKYFNKPMRVKFRYPVEGKVLFECPGCNYREFADLPANELLDPHPCDAWENYDEH